MLMNKSWIDRVGAIRLLMDCMIILKQVTAEVFTMLQLILCLRDVRTKQFFVRKECALSGTQQISESTDSANVFSNIRSCSPALG